MSKSKILVIHDGNQEYLKKCVLQARKISNDVKFIGKSDIYKNELKADEILSAQRSIDLFLSNYKHMSTNPEWIEISCFNRYFYAYEYAKGNALTDMWIIDSDVMIFTNLIDISKKGQWLNFFDAGLSIPSQSYASYDWAASPHTSWWSIDGLKSFIEFILETYKKRISILEEKYKFNELSESRGGICDMTLLYLWSLDKKIFNFAERIAEGFYIDHNINQKNILDRIEVKMKYGIKRVAYDNKHVKITTIDGNEIKVGSLHFQGKAKNFMGIFRPGLQNNLSCIFILCKFAIYRFIKRYKKI